MGTLGTFKPDGLIAGNFPTAVQEITIAGPAEIRRGDVLGVNADGNYLLVDSNATDGSQTVRGIACDDVSVGNDTTSVTTMFIKGEFNRRFLRFGGTDTVETHFNRMTDISLIVRSTRV